MNLGGGVLSFILLVAAVVCFVLAALPINDVRVGRLGAWGLAFWAGSALVARLGG